MTPVQEKSEASPPAARIRWGRIAALAVKIILPVAIVAVVVYRVRFAPVPVSVHLVDQGNLVEEVFGTGTLESHFKASISPKISGLITEVRVDQGDRVKAGEVLFRLDDRDLKRQVEIAESDLAAARAAVDRQSADRDRTKAVLDLARIDYRRTKDLFAKQSAASIEMDKATETLRAAEADLKRAAAALTEARAQLVAAEKTLDYSRARLADTIVKAPFAGLIAQRDHDPGDVVVPGTGVLLLLDTREMWISAWVGETEMSKLNPGQSARVVFRSEPQHNYDGVVARLGREADPETREFLVDVRVPKLPSNWASGQRAEVYIETRRAENVLRMPVRFIIWRDRKSGVFVELDGRAVWRLVQLGLRGRDLVEIRDGLRLGERLIAPAKAGAEPLHGGQWVKAL